jgi:hypothetical protein
MQGVLGAVNVIPNLILTYLLITSLYLHGSPSYVYNYRSRLSVLANS